MKDTLSRINYIWLSWLNRVVCLFMYQVKKNIPIPIPEKGPVLLVCDHSSLGDPLVLLASAGRPISFLMAQEIYASCFQWVYDAFNVIPVRRGRQDIHAVRGMVRQLEKGGAVGLFPEGGLDNFRDEHGHPGVGYLALKTGATVVPASVVWDKERSVSSILKTLFHPSKATVCYGRPFTYPREPRPARAQIKEVTLEVMKAINELRRNIVIA